MFTPLPTALIFLQLRVALHFETVTQAPIVQPQVLHRCPLLLFHAELPARLHLLLFLHVHVVPLRLLDLPLETPTFLLLIVEQTLQFQYLILELPQLGLSGGGVGLDCCYLLLEVLFLLDMESNTSAIWLHSLTNIASRITIFSFSIRNNLELRTTSSDITISWCYFSLALNRLSCMYFRPRVLPTLPRKGEGSSSLPAKGLEQSERVFSERECFLSSTVVFLTPLSSSRITNFIISRALSLVSFFLILNHTLQSLDEFTVVLRHEVGALGVLLGKVVGLFPLVDVVLCVSVVESGVVVVGPATHLDVPEPDAPGHTTQVVDLEVASLEQAEHFVGLVVIQGEHFLLDLAGVVAAVRDGTRVVVGVEPVVHKHGEYNLSQSYLYFTRQYQQL